MRCGDNLPASRPATGGLPPAETPGAPGPGSGAPGPGGPEGPGSGGPATEVPRDSWGGGSPTSEGSGVTWPGDPPAREFPGAGWPGTEGWPAGPAGPVEHDRAPGSRWKGLALWVALFVVLAGGGSAAGLLLSGRHGQQARVVDRTSSVPKPATVPGTETSPGTPAPGDGSAQAEDMDTLLRAVKATRAKVPGTLGSCDNVTTDLGSVQEVVQERQDQANAAAGLNVDGLTGGTDLRQALEDLTRRTLEADQAYLSWAQAAQSGDCTDVTDSGPIGDANQRAADAKRHFVSLWNDVADRYGLPNYVWKDF